MKRQLTEMHVAINYEKMSNLTSSQGCIHFKRRGHFCPSGWQKKCKS